MRTELRKILAVVMVLALAVSMFAFTASANDDTTVGDFIVATQDEATLDETTPDETTTDEVTTEDEPVVTPDEPVVTPDEPVVTPDEPVATPDVLLYGDVNLSGNISISDATEVQKAVALLIELSELQATLADVDADDVITIKDATEIQKYIALLPVDGLTGVVLGEEPTPDEITTPDEPVVTPDEPVVTPDEPVVTPDEPVVTPDEPVVTPDEEPVVTPDEPVEQPTTFYTVAGEAGLCNGIGWDPAQNVMNYDGDGTWSITFTGVAAGTYQFKVVQEGVWGNPDYNLEGLANSSGNASITVESDNATVVIGFDGTKAIIESIA